MDYVLQDLRYLQRGVAAVMGLLVIGSLYATITGVRPGEIVLQRPADSTAEQPLVYGLGFPLQISPDTAGVFLNRRMNGMKYTDFEAGTDLILIKDLSAPPDPAGAIALSRNHDEDYRRPDGRTIRVTMVKYPLRGGFVPAGARRADGSPHPHAGTGFGVTYASGFAINREDGAGLPRFFHHYFEVQQYDYDGKRFRVSSTERRDFDRLLPGWFLTTDPLNNAIPDGDDLLFAFRGGKTAGDVGQGMLRWQRSAGTWRPVSFVNITGAEGAKQQGLEPTVVRDRDGSLLFTARNTGGPERFHSFKVWRSVDRGQTWKKIIDLPRMREQSPVSLNRAADGSPYLATNFLLDAVTFPDGTPRPPGPRSERPSYSRERIGLWPLLPGRDGVADPIVLFDAWKELPHDGKLWWVDHPVGATVRLADRAWHDIVCFRIVSHDEVRGLAGPTSQSGFHIREIRTAGPVQPPWRF